MTWKASTGSLGRMTARLTMAIVFVLAGASAAPAQQSKSAGRMLEGTWHVQVTPRNCATGAAIAPAINSLVTFAAGGTMTEAAGGLNFAPGQRTPGHGTWTHKGGLTYDQRFVALIVFTTAPSASGPGFEAGWSNINHTVEVIDADHIESAGTNAYYRLTGELYRSGCSTAVGQRFQ